MFQGHAICSLDEKSRLILPVKFRKFISPEADNRLIITRGFDKSLLLYPKNIWERVLNGLLNFNFFNSEQRFFVREFLMYVNECELDSQNRIVLPQQLLDFAKIDKQVIVLGLLDKLEIWSPSIKDKLNKEQKKSYEEVAEKILSLAGTKI